LCSIWKYVFTSVYVYTEYILHINHSTLLRADGLLIPHTREPFTHNGDLIPHTRDPFKP